MTSGPGHHIWDFPALSPFTATENSFKPSPRDIIVASATVSENNRASPFKDWTLAGGSAEQESQFCPCDTLCVDSEAPRQPSGLDMMMEM